MAKVTTGVNGNNMDLYPQTRGSNGQFGSRQAPANGANGLLYYVYNGRNEEKRKITNQSGGRVPTRIFTTVTGSGNGYQGPGF